MCYHKTCIDHCDYQSPCCNYNQQDASIFTSFLQIPLDMTPSSGLKCPSEHVIVDLAQEQLHSCSSGPARLEKCKCTCGSQWLSSCVRFSHKWGHLISLPIIPCGPKHHKSQALKSLGESEAPSELTETLQHLDLPTAPQWARTMAPCQHSKPASSAR